MAKMTKMRKKVAKKGSAAGAGKTGASPKKAAVNRGAINKKNKVVSRKDRKSKFLDRGSPPPPPSSGGIPNILDEVAA